MSKYRKLRSKNRCSAIRFRPTVTQLEDRSVPATIVVTGTGDNIAVDGVVTLREAITAANTNRVSGDAPAGDLGLDTIQFAIESGLQTINLATPLPAISDRINIDGTSQPGFVDRPIVELVAPAGNPSVGLTLQNSRSTIRGLILNKFATAISLAGGGSHLVAGNFIGTNANGDSVVLGQIGIAVQSANNVIGGAGRNGNLIAGQSLGISISGATNRVYGNRIGTDLTGVIALRNAIGISIGKTASRNMIGGTDLETHGQNVISGNDVGVEIAGNQNVVQANLIGTDAIGKTALGNLFAGVIIYGARNTIGGTALNAGNVISGNSFAGIELLGKQTVIQGNRIGTDASGTLPLGNGGIGVHVIGSSNNLIGGNVQRAANLIAYNGTFGIAVPSGTGNAIRRNSIFENGEIAIDLRDDGASINDELDLDTGANGVQNFPVLVSGVWNQGSFFVQGVLHSRPNRSYIIDLYSDSKGTNPESGQGEMWLGSKVVKTDAWGDAQFEWFTYTSIPKGHYVTATATPAATAPYGDTSEFSPVLELFDASGGGQTAAAAAPKQVTQKLAAHPVQPLLTEAIARWDAAGEDTSRIRDVQVRVTNLGGNLLGLAVGNTIWLDDNAAGWGWFVDHTPHDDAEFTTPGNQGEQGRMDLLSVLMHELGHVLGHEHEDDGVMHETLAAGERLTLHGGDVNDYSWLFGLPDPTKKRDAFGWWL